MIGGTHSNDGAVPYFMFVNAIFGTFAYFGVDLTLFSAKTLVDHAGLQGTVTFSYCKMPATYTLTDTVSSSNAMHADVRTIGCTNDTGLGSTNALEQFAAYNGQGYMDHEQTIYYTAGASTGAAAGNFSIAIKPEIYQTHPFVGYNGRTHNWQESWLEGDGTAKTLTVFINTDDTVDYVEGEVILEVMYMDAAGTAQMNYVTNRPSIISPVTPAALTDGVNGDWAGALTHAQELSVALAPDYQGPLMWRVWLHKAYAATPKTLYLNPKEVIT